MSVICLESLDPTCGQSKKNANGPLYLSYPLKRFYDPSRRSSGSRSRESKEDDSDEVNIIGASAANISNFFVLPKIRTALIVWGLLIFHTDTLFSSYPYIFCIAIRILIATLFTNMYVFGDIEFKTALVIHLVGQCITNVLFPWVNG